ncbi:MAG: hypothetical protein ACREJ3_02135, partial [Polyangiaceae bacterium]
MARSWMPFNGPGFNYSIKNDVALVWTGTDVVAFGYSDGLENGHVPLTSMPSPVAISYDVQTGTLKNINLQGAPSTRNGSDVLWTGTRVLVWGGGSSPFKVSRDSRARAVGTNIGVRHSARSLAVETCGVFL